MEVKNENRIIDIEEAKNMAFDAGMDTLGWDEKIGLYFKPYVGGPKFFQSSDITAKGGKAHYIRGDGACWARSLWQTVFSQIYMDEAEFDKFIQCIAHPKENYNLNLQLGKETIHILYQLKNKTFEQRNNYLNLPKVDDVLIFFMRDIAGEHDFIENKNEQKALAIKTDKFGYGSLEMRYFLIYFELDTHYIYRDFKKEFCYDFQSKDSYSDGKSKVNIIERNKLNNLETVPHCSTYTATESHYEFISFPKQREEIPSINALKNEFKDLGKTDNTDEQVEQISKEILLKLQKIYFGMDWNLGNFGWKEIINKETGKYHTVHKGVELMNAVIELAKRNHISWNHALLQIDVIVDKYAVRYSSFSLNFFDMPTDSVKCFYNSLNTMFDLIRNSKENVNSFVTD